ncbi:hypothetical protein J2805_003337 [Arthrobacter oryzae]|nr:hypothetical protein [Arthrobacter oryzae]
MLRTMARHTPFTGTPPVYFQTPIMDVLSFWPKPAHPRVALVQSPFGMSGVVANQRPGGGREERTRRTSSGSTSWTAAWGRQGDKWGRAHCAHSGLRTGPYVGRIRPESACFREFPVFGGAGVRFESHLGHGIPPRQRGFLLLSVDNCGHWPLMCGAGLCLAARWPVQLWGSGFRVVAPAPSACSELGSCVPLLVRPVGRGWPTPLHG